MNVLLRHTILGEAIRKIDPYHSAYADESDTTTLKCLTTLQDAQSNATHTDENSALLASGEDAFGSQTLLVDWYSVDDADVRIPFA